MHEPCRLRLTLIIKITIKFNPTILGYFELRCTCMVTACPKLKLLYIYLSFGCIGDVFWTSFCMALIEY